MKNHVQPGKRMLWENTTGSDVASGDPVIVGGMVCVAAVDIADTETGNVAVGEVYTMPKATGAGTAIAQGERPAFKATVFSGAAAVATDTIDAAVCWEAAADGDATVDVFLLESGGSIVP